MAESEAEALERRSAALAAAMREWQREHGEFTAAEFAAANAVFDRAARNS